MAFCSSVRDGGLPILFLLVLAVCRPALVYSDMSARSYSANAEEIWKNILPRAVVVSIPSLGDESARPWLASLLGLPLGL